jgi:hypothetical protein
MTACPYCAEPIQASAVFCKHCRRDIAATGAKPPQPGGKMSLGTRIWSLTLFGCLALLAYLKITGANRLPLPHFGLLGARLWQPKVTVISNNDDLEIPALQVRYYEWQAVPPQITCHLNGRVLVVSGGNKDIDVLVMPKDDLENWLNNHAAKAYYQSGHETAVTLNTTIVGPGNYVLVLSNMISVITEKTVQTQDVRITCT